MRAPREHEEPHEDGGAPTAQSSRVLLSCLGAFVMLPPRAFLPFLPFLASLPALAAPPVAPQVPADCPPELAFPLPGVKLTLVAEHPQVVTPVGIDADAQGRAWVALSHTHFRPAGYPGPEHDEIVVLSEPDAGGRARTRSVFYEKTTATMGLVLGPDAPARNASRSDAGRWVYLAERSRLLRVQDTDGDGRGDREETLARLETEETYPHNGLSGLAWHPSGDLLLSLGENMWKTWTLVAADGATIRGSGEGGVFRCRPDGSQMRRIAVGFWNPFGLCVRGDGEIFVAENDPGSRPPCRLLHIVEGGDYGYQRAYGEAPFHPFVCWNGELRGTLPMIAATGEAPCGVQPLGGGVIASSWTDHRIDFFALKRRGASLTAERVPIVAGGAMFRPTSIARVAEGVFYVTDWVFGSYPLHQRGRVWKLEIDAAAADAWLQPARPEPPNEAAKQFAALRDATKTPDVEAAFTTARGGDPFLARAALLALARQADAWMDRAAERSERDRISACLALKLARPKDAELARRFLADASGEVQFEALRWIADERLADLLPKVEATLRQPGLDYRRFEAALAALNTLHDSARAGVNDPAMLLERVRDATAPPRIRAYALRLLRPRPGQVKIAELRELLELNDEALSLEVVRALPRAGEGARPILAELAADEARPAALRAEAIGALAADADPPLSLWLTLSRHADATIREEALRSLRLAALSDEQKASLRAVAAQFPASADLVSAVLSPGANAAGRPPLHDLAAWSKLLAQAATRPDAEAGQRIFFHPRLAQCATCHPHSGRGNVVGPDLSAVSARGDAAWLLQAILDPSRDVAPQYHARALELKDGSGFVGILLRDGGGGREYYRDLTGSERAIATDDVVRREELTTSVMPPGLLAMLTDREIRDLLAFLAAPPVP
jgi:hypothetical protein